MKQPLTKHQGRLELLLAARQLGVQVRWDEGACEPLYSIKGASALWGALNLAPRRSGKACDNATLAHELTHAKVDGGGEGVQPEGRNRSFWSLETRLARRHGGLEAVAFAVCSHEEDCLNSYDQRSARDYARALRAKARHARRFKRVEAAMAAERAEAS